jgi:hypothetical protein
MKISSLSSKSLNSVTADDFLLVANTTAPANFKFVLQNLFPTVATLGTSSESLFVSITNKNTLNFKGIKSLNSLLTVATASNNITLQVNEANIDLNNCDNSTSGFISSADLTSDVTGILPVANGGTGVNSLTSNSLILGNGGSALSSLGAATNGQIPIGRTGLSPVLGTLTAGTNVSITNGSGSITINAALSAFTSTINASGYNLYGLNWLSGDTGNRGVKITTTGQTFVGSGTPTAFFTGDLNVNQDIYLAGGVTQYIRQSSSSGSAGIFVIKGGDRATSAGVGGGVRLMGGDSIGANAGGDIGFYTGKHDGSGSAGSFIFYGYNSSATLQEVLRMSGETRRVGINNSSPTTPLDVKQDGTTAALPPLRLEQLDTDESFINFVGTSGAASANSLSSSSASAGAKTGAIRIKINGVDAWIRVYATAE